MINIIEDIHSLTEFKNNTNNFIEDLKKTKRPTILTVHGKAELVVIDAKAFQKLQDRLEMQSSISTITSSLADFEMEKFVSSKDVFSNLKKRLNKSKKSHK